MRGLILGMVIWCAFSGICLGQATKPSEAKKDLLPSLSNTSVSIPWGDLKELMEKARGVTDRPPVDFVYSPAKYTAVVSEKAVRVVVEVDVTVLSEQWAMVPVGPAAGGMVEAKVDGEVCALVVQKDGLFALLNGKGKKKLELVVSRPVVVEAGENRMELPLVASALANLTVTIPETKLMVRTPGATAIKTSEKENATTVTASYRGGGVADISWSQRPVAQQQAARVYAETQTLASVEKGLLRTSSKTVVQIERGNVRELRLGVDPGAVVLSVAGKDVAQWAEEVKDAAKTRVIVVTFADAVDGERTIKVVCERDIPDAGGEMAISPISVEGAKRDRGVISVQTMGGFDVRPGKSNAQRMGISLIPAELRESAKGALQFAYQYGEPTTIGLVLERKKVLAAKLFASTMTRVAVDRGVLRCRATLQYEIVNSGVDSLRVALPGDVEVENVMAESMREKQIVTEGKQRILVVGLKDVVSGVYTLGIDYELRFKEEAGIPNVPLVSAMDAAQEHGYVGIEVRGSYEIAPAMEGMERIDVKELPRRIWEESRSPILFGYRYSSMPTKFSIALTKHEELDVLIAMCDVCEVTTTFTEDGKSVTKMMFVVRNNLKPFMSLKLPEGAQLWSAFVDDRPVTPSKNKTGVLIPLKKSEEVEEDDQESYRNKREERRADQQGQRPKHQRDLQARKVDEREEAKDLRPYDVEIVFVMPPVKVEERGQLKFGLPSSDVPVGHMAWAIFLPKSMRVTDARGNFSEVAKFSLPFRHFGDVEYQRVKQLAMDKAEMMKQAQAQQGQKQDAAKALADAAKAEGVLPVRIEIPVTGEIYRFEKFLAVEESPEMTVTYSRKLQ